MTGDASGAIASYCDMSFLVRPRTAAFAGRAGGWQVGKVLAAAITLLSFWLGAAHDASATLGEDVGSVASNVQALSATRKVQKLASGERHELTLASGVVVHEYVSASGVVYAVTWRGPRMPDLRELLGSYFAQLSARAPTGGHHRVTLRGVDVVIRSGGHGHSFAGRAWVPSLVPNGVDVDASLD
jgi:hypothetical protein